MHAAFSSTRSALFRVSADFYLSPARRERRAFTRPPMRLGPGVHAIPQPGSGDPEERRRKHGRLDFTRSSAFQLGLAIGCDWLEQTVQWKSLRLGLDDADWHKDPESCDPGRVERFDRGR